MKRNFARILAEKDDKRTLRQAEIKQRQEEKFESETREKYEEMRRKPLNNNPLILVEVLSIKSIIFEFRNFFDKFPCLRLRRYSLLGAKYF